MNWSRFVILFNLSIIFFCDVKFTHSYYEYIYIYILKNLFYSMYEDDSKSGPGPCGPIHEGANEM